LHFKEVPLLLLSVQASVILVADVGVALRLEGTARLSAGFSVGVAQAASIATSATPMAGPIPFIRRRDGCMTVGGLDGV